MAAADPGPVWTPHWLRVALAYQVPAHLWVTALRCVAIALGVALLYFSTDRRWAIGTDRRAVYALVGLLAILQEGNQVTFAAPMLVWRLPMLLAIEVACFLAMRRYISGRYTGDVKRRN